MKRTFIAASLLSVLSPVSAQNEVINSQYMMIVPLKDRLSTWNSAESDFSLWENVGSHYDCGAWSPQPEDVDFGSVYLQTRECSQNQTRVETIKEYDKFSDSYKAVDEKIHNQTITETESKNETGTRRDWSTFDSTFTSWNDFGSEHSYTDWSPEAVSQASDFQQSRGYHQPQERFEQKREKDAVTSDIRDVGAPIRHTQEDARTENRQVNVTASAWYNTTTENFSSWAPVPASQVADFQQSRGFTQNQSKDWDYQVDGSTIHSRTTTQQLVSQSESRTVSVVASAWSDTTRSDYSTWTPAPTTQTDIFSQSRDYTQNQTRNWTYKAGSSDLYDRDETRGVPSTENRSVSVSWDAWTNTSVVDTHSCTAWSPETNTKGHGESFTQTRTCQEPQTRVRTYKDGSTTLISKTESRDLPNIESRAATGVGSWSATTPTYTSWTNDGSAYDHGSYSPVASSQTSNFSQSRSYKQDQVRARQNREIDSISGAIRNVGAAITESQTLTPSESRAVTVTAGGWVNTSSSGHTSWLPVADAQVSGFTQSRSYAQAQSRVWNYKTGSTTLHTRNETQTLTGQTETRSVAVSWSNWVADTSKADHSFGTWSPATNTIGYGVSFTQSRNYKDPEKRTRTYKVGSTTIASKAEARDFDRVQTQAATGVGSWSATTPTYTSWENDGAAYSFSSYSPTASTQTANFSQSRSYKQNQKRTRQNREVDSISGAIRNVGSAITETKTLNLSQSRTIGVTAGSWSNTSTSSHTAWSPTASAQTANFTQSRSYTQSQNRVWSYKSGTSTIHTRNELRNLTSQSESRSVAVSWSSWIEDTSKANHSHTSWTPGADTVNHGVQFTQSRSYKNPEKRTRAYKVSSVTIDSKTESRDTTLSETREATGTKNIIVGTVTKNATSWTAQSGLYNCTSWSPAANTLYKSDSWYSQSQTCETKSTRTVDIYNVWSNGSETFKVSESQVKMDPTTKSQNVKGTKELSTPECREFSWGNTNSDGRAIYNTSGNNWTLIWGRTTVASNYPSSSFKTYHDYAWKYYADTGAGLKLSMGTGRYYNICRK